MATSFGTGGGVGTDKNMARNGGSGGKGSAQGKATAAASAAHKSGGGASSSAKAKAKAQPAQAAHDKSARTTGRASRGVSVPRLFTRPGVEPLENGAPGLRTVTGAADRARLRASLERHHEPRRLGRLQDGRRRDPGDVVAARDRHRRLQVLPQGRPPRRREAGRDERAPGRLPHRAHDPRGGREVRRLLRHARPTPTRSRPSSPSCWSTRSARSTRRSGSTAASGHEYGIDGLGRQLGLGRDAAEGRVMVETTNAYERPQCSACFIQAVERRPDEHLRAREERGAPLQVRLGHRLELQHASAARRRSSPAAARRAGLMSFLEVLRPRGGRDQVGRHHAPRREDGLPRHGPPRDRRLHQLEDRARRSKAHGADRRGLLERLQRRGLPHGQRPELEQLGPRHRRVHAAPSTRAASGRRSRARPARSSTRYDAQGPVATGRRGRVGLRRSGRAVRHDDQPAGTPARTAGSINAIEPVLRVHVPRRHGLQPGVAEPDEVPATTDGALRRRRLPPRDAASSSWRRRSSSISRATRPKTIAQNSPRLPPARPRLREPRHAAHAAWASRTTRTRAARSPARSPRSCAARPTRSAPRWRPRKGAFAGFAKNREPMLRVMGMHRDAAYADQPRQVPARALARGVRGLGRGRRSSASSTATATRRPRCSRRPARSACSWTATPPASSPTSRS